MTDELSTFLERASANIPSGDSNMFALDSYVWFILLNSLCSLATCALHCLRERKKLIESLPTITEDQLVSLDHKGHFNHLVGVPCSLADYP